MWQRRGGEGFHVGAIRAYHRTVLGGVGRKKGTLAKGAAQLVRFVGNDDDSRSAPLAPSPRLERRQQQAAQEVVTKVVGGKRALELGVHRIADEAKRHIEYAGVCHKNVNAAAGDVSAAL